MTKEDRLLEIKDQARYLDLLYRTIMSGIHTSPKIIGLGFSQGIATLARWLANGQSPVDFFVNWAGSMPADVDYKSSAILGKVTPIVLFGDDDPFINEGKVKKEMELLSSIGWQAKVIRYEGGHRVLPGPLGDLAKWAQRK